MAFAKGKTTRSTAQDAAFRAVFHTSELVENILVYLPARDIFRVQRVSMSFNNAIANSRRIQEKLFLRKKTSEPETKTIVYGYQHTAAILNGLFEPSSSATGVYGQHVTKTYAEGRDYIGSDAVHGVTLPFLTKITPQSSLLDTFLLDRTCTISSVSFEVRIGDSGTSAFIRRDKVAVQEDWTIRDILEEVLTKKCKMLVMSEVAARRHRQEYAYKLPFWTLTNGWWDSDLQPRGDVKIPSGDLKKLKQKAADALNDASWRAYWQFKIHDIPRVVISALESIEWSDSKIYIDPSQGPTFWLLDIVIPSPQDWAEIEARKNPACVLV